MRNGYDGHRIDNHMTVAAGIDGWKGGWVAVVLRDGRFGAAVAARRLSDLLSGFDEASVVGIDMPIGFPTRGTRLADEEARRLVGRLRSSVFLVPPRSVMEASTYLKARRVARRVWHRSVSAQTYALRGRMLEVEAAAVSDPRLIEVHPEVSFQAMAGEPLQFSKRSWNGQHRRSGLLAAHGIELPATLERAGRVPVDDLLDAAAVAWSAERHLLGRAAQLPADADPAVEPVIWY